MTTPYGAANPENVPHSPEFFDQMRSCRDAYRLLGECFHETLLPLLNPSAASSNGFTSAITGRPIPPFVPRGAGRLLTLMDVGCGVGAQTARMAELGWSAVGADPFGINVEVGFAFRTLDILETDPRLRYDAIVCTETAEHLNENRADSLVGAVASRAEKAIVWSAAVPGQEWEGHVNLQPPEYWLEKFRALGWVQNEGFTNALRVMIVSRRAQHWMAAGNFYVLVKPEPGEQ